MEEFKTIAEKATGEIEEKKSRFIANIYYIEDEEQAKSYIKEIKKKYQIAKHNCFAYKVANNGKVIERSSDDGEPSGTAGIPMLNIINGEGLCNVLIIVTRYFGGILLGTGGLVRSYTEAAKTALSKAKIVEKIVGYEVKIIVSYTELDKFEYYARQKNLKIISKSYDENVEIIVEIPKELKQDFLNYDNNKLRKITNCDFLKEKYIDK